MRRSVLHLQSTVARRAALVGWLAIGPGLAIAPSSAHATEDPVDVAETTQERIALIETLTQELDTLIEQLEGLALGSEEEAVGVLTDDARVEAKPPEQEVQTSLRDDARLEVERAASRREAAEHPVLTELSDDQLHTVESLASSMLEERFDELQEVLVVYEIVEKPAPARACNHGTYDYDYDYDYYDSSQNYENCRDQCWSLRYACQAQCEGLPSGMWDDPYNDCRTQCGYAQTACENSC